ncbi:hypothetical protein [Nannocystis sp.]|uniref:hypothetical protein n=1 Tax=Nannocystis sp. TaxID=1962667 RepID=UPI0025F9B078|nr:hypothetical protein [Nannocystis sp.]MBK7829056.1 zinc finger-like domain-containing protein [Nannocystis sp.]
MFGDVAMPDLDLSAVDGPCRPLPWRVARILAEGLEAADEAAYTRTRSYCITDDDADQPATLSYRVRGSTRSIPLRKARDAWRVASECGLVPHSWRDDARRGFADQEILFFCDACGGMGATGYNYDDLCGDCHGKGNAMVRRTTSSPTSIAAMWMVALPEVVEAAEAAAREAVRRLTNAPAVDRIQWGRVREGKPCGTVPLVLTSPIWDRVRPQPWDWRRMKGPAFRQASWWKAAAKLTPETREMLCFDVGGAWAQRAAGIVASPFEPLLRLWELGVVFEELRDDVIVLDRACARTFIRSWRAHSP